MMNVYYVYFYLRKDHTPYYVGKGKGDRYKRKDKTGMRVPADKKKIILVEQNLTELCAFMLERYYIRWFGRKDNGTGILRNRTDGGEGSSGIIHSQETRNKISNTLKGRPSKFKGIPRTEETKQKMSAALKGNPAWNAGLSGINRKSIEVLNSNFERVGILNGTTEITRAGFKYNTVYEVIHGKHKHHKNHYFRYLDTKEESYFTG